MGVYKLKHQGFQYDFSFAELIYIIFKQKECPKCGGKLIKRKHSETVLGAELNSKADPMFVPNAKIKHFKYTFLCLNCGREFNIDELI